MLTLHYTEFLEETDGGEPLMLDWISQNPSTEPGCWRDAWNSYAISIRCVVWMQRIAVRASSFSDAGLLTINESLSEQVRFLARNIELDIRGNHLIKNLKCLMWAGRYFKGAEADAWFHQATQLLRESIQEQILDDGMHFERSASYHNQVLADLCECCSLMNDSPERDELGDTLDAMAQVSVDLTHPDGHPSMMNDGGYTMAYSTEEILQVLTQLGRRPPTQQAVVNLSHAGYFGRRDGDNFVLMDCGPIGPEGLPAHAHGDVLSFEWSIDGERTIVDAGVFEYRAGDNRSYARSTTAHNTVTIGGEDQAEFWSSFRVGRRPHVTLDHFGPDEARIVLRGSHDGYSRLDGSPIHCRSFEVAEDVVRISDRVDGGRGQLVTASLLIPGSLTVDRAADGLDIRGEKFVLRVTSDAPLTTEDSEYSTDLGHRNAATRIVAHYGPAPASGELTLSVMERGRKK